MSNLGLIRAELDRVLVRNELQKREAVELHGVAPHRVIVTGAPRFDEFFVVTPTTTLEEFRGRVGLDPVSPILLYVRSSEFVAPSEVEFVQRWIDGVRRSADPVVRSCGVLVRPHPGHMKQWWNVDLSALRTDADGRAVERTPVARRSDA